MKASRLNDRLERLVVRLRMELLSEEEFVAQVKLLIQGEVKSAVSRAMVEAGAEGGRPAEQGGVALPAGGDAVSGGERGPSEVVEGKVC